MSYYGKSHGGGKAWIPFNFKAGMDRADQGDANVEATTKKTDQAIADQSTAQSELEKALLAREKAITKQEERISDQETQLTLESGMRRYEKETRGRLFGYDYENTLDALGNSEITLTQDKIDTITDAVKDEQRDNIPEVKFPCAMLGGFAALSGLVYFIQKRRQ